MLKLCYYVSQIYCCAKCIRGPGRETLEKKTVNEEGKSVEQGFEIAQRFTPICQTWLSVNPHLKSTLVLSHRNHRGYH